MKKYEIIQHQYQANTAEYMIVNTKTGEIIKDNLINIYEAKWNVPEDIINNKRIMESF